MTQHYPKPIAPPPELVQQWADMLASRSDEAVFSLAAQWGGDQELEACCEWLVKQGWFSADEHEAIEELRAARRPKPPSLKEQAMEDLDSLIADLANHGMGFKATNIRRALEQLDD